MNQEEIKELFRFCEERFSGFEVKDVDESSHYYITDAFNNKDSIFIGGYRGDTREFFYKASDTLAFVIQTMDLHKKLRPIHKTINKTETNIELTIKTRDRGFGTEIVNIFSSMSLGYQDGPDEPIYDIYSKNLNNLIENLNEAKSCYFHSPVNPVFYIEGHKFTNYKDGNFFIDENFPKDLLKKYEGVNVNDLFIEENTDNTFSVLYANSLPYDSRKFPFLIEKLEDKYDPRIPLKFESFDSALKELNSYLNSENSGFENVLLNNEIYDYKIKKTLSKKLKNI